MIKFLFAGRRAPGRTRHAAQHHLQHGHGRAVVMPPPDSGPMPIDYVQNHVLDGSYPGVGHHAIERDLMTELWFEDLAHLRASVATPYYQQVLRPDEPRFVDDATVAKMQVDPVLIKDGRRTRCKLAWLLTHEETDRDLLPATSMADFQRIVLNRVAPPPDGPAFVTTVIEAWHDDLDAVRRHADHWPFDDRIDRTRSLGLLLEEFTTTRLRDSFV
jgi:hypothetical protein